MDPEEDEQPTPFLVSMDSKEISCNKTGTGPVCLIFTHGAGGTIASDGMANFSSGFSKDSRSSVICFQGNMNLKSRVKMFDAVHDSAIGTYKHETPLALGGRSMGARAAVLAAMRDTKCLILASYPLQTDKEVRDQILLDLPAQTDVLFISGDHDSMCDIQKLNEVRGKMKAKTWLITVRDADHGMNMKPKKATKAAGEETGLLAAEWLHDRQESETERAIWWGEDELGEECVHSGRWTNTVDLKKKTEVKAKPSKSKMAPVSNVASDSKRPKNARAMPATAKKAGNSAERLQEKRADETDIIVSEPLVEPRRPKRRKVTS